MVGSVLGHFRILEKIGEGGMGVVYRAHDERLDRDVALKVLPAGTLADETARKRFRKEALALSKLNHPIIETVHDFDTQGGVDFLVMEYIPGVTLSDRVSAGPLPEKEIFRLGTQLAEGLAAAHEQNVVHRDLKPGNLRIMPDGRLKILDFGLAKLVRPFSDVDVTASVTESRAVSGTLPYMAPEQLQGAPVDARTDIYASGTVLYEMATGRLPFRETLSTALADAILHKPTPPPGRLKPELSPRLEEIILKCLEKEPENRYQSAKELLVDLRRLAAPSAEIPPRREPRVSEWLRRRTALATGIALVVLLAVLYALNVGGWRGQLLGREDAPAIKSLAVLPLENLSRDAEQEYFSDGMTEALIAGLSKISALRVISRTSVMQYKGAKKPLPQIARELGVDAVIEGSVLRSGDRVRITAQLIGAVPERHVWANSYDRDLRDVLALQSDVVRAIADEIQIKLAARPQFAAARTVNSEAYEAYLKGRYFAAQFTPEGVSKSLEFFEKAIKTDPHYALGYAGLAMGYFKQGVLAPLGPQGSREALLKAKSTALRALELDEQLAEAHAILATATWFYDWDWAGAAKEYQRALELDPNSADARRHHAMYLLASLRFEEAIAESQRALRLDPISLEANSVAGTVLYWAGEHDRALQQCQRSLEIDPNFARDLVLLGSVYEAKGMYPQAIAAYQKSRTLRGDSPEHVAQLERAYAARGKQGIYEWWLEMARRDARAGKPTLFLFAQTYAELGQKNQAFIYLEKMYQERNGNMLFLRVIPRFKSLRADPRFQDLLRRMNFPQ